MAPHSPSNSSPRPVSLKQNLAALVGEHNLAGTNRHAGLSMRRAGKHCISRLSLFKGERRGYHTVPQKTLVSGIWPTESLFVHFVNYMLSVLCCCPFFPFFFIFFFFCTSDAFLVNILPHQSGALVLHLFVFQHYPPSLLFSEESDLFSCFFMSLHLVFPCVIISKLKHHSLI